MRRLGSQHMMSAPSWMVMPWTSGAGTGISSSTSPSSRASLWMTAIALSPHQMASPSSAIP